MRKNDKKLDINNSNLEDTKSIIERYDKAIAEAKYRLQDFALILVAENEEYRKASAEFERIAALIENELPEEKRHLASEFIDAALYRCSAEGDFMYESGFNDGKSLSGLVNIIQDSIGDTTL